MFVAAERQAMQQTPGRQVNMKQQHIRALMKKHILTSFIQRQET